ncbi:hypothetical protein BH11PLA1_BH11PLA1_21840 [soil metagenome]
MSKAPRKPAKAAQPAKATKAPAAAKPGMKRESTATPAGGAKARTVNAPLASAKSGAVKQATAAPRVANTPAPAASAPAKKSAPSVIAPTAPTVPPPAARPAKAKKTPSRAKAVDTRPPAPFPSDISPMERLALLRAAAAASKAPTAAPAEPVAPRGAPALPEAGASSPSNASNASSAFASRFAPTAAAAGAAGASPGQAVQSGGASPAAAPGSSASVPQGTPQRFIPRVAQPSVNPKKVRGGFKLSSKSGPVSPAWAAQRWMRLLDEHANHQTLAEGIHYAREGQTKALILPTAPAAPNAAGASVGAGHISARVQGRLPTPYTVDIRVPIFTFEQWERVISTMVAEARHVAGMLAGEVPPAIEDVFRPHGLRLFPQDPSDVAVSCSCRRQNDVAAAALATYRMTPGMPGSASGSGVPMGAAVGAADGEVGEEGGNGDGDASAVASEKSGMAGPRLAGRAEGAHEEADGAPARADAAPLEAEASEDTETATCAGGPARDERVTGPFCKHVCCVMALIAEKLGQDPFLVFGLRGLWKEDLLERLRQTRTLAQSRASAAGAPGDRPIATFSPRIAGVTDASAIPLEDTLENFWSMQGSLRELDLVLAPPAVGHPLLRRLGASPFAGARFPLVGLLATCYDTISADALKGDAGAHAHTLVDATDDEHLEGADDQDDNAAPAPV